MLEKEIPPSDPEIEPKPKQDSPIDKPKKFIPKSKISNKDTHSSSVNDNLNYNSYRMDDDPIKSEHINNNYDNSNFNSTSNFRDKEANFENKNLMIQFDKEFIPSEQDQKIKEDALELSLIKPNLSTELLYKLIISPIMKHKIMRCNLEVESLKNKKIYRVYLSDDTSTVRKLILYSVCNETGKYYIGMGNKFNENLGVVKNTIIPFGKKKNSISNLVNRNYLAKMNMNLIRTDFNVCLQEKTYNEENNCDNDDLKKNDDINQNNAKQTNNNENRFTELTTKSYLDGEKLTEKNGELLNICSIQYKSNIFKSIENRNLDVIIPKPVCENNKENRFVYNKQNSRNLFSLFNNDLTTGISDMFIFSNKKPLYNKDHNCLVLNFGKRNVIKSKRNFQLVEKGENFIYLQFGKVTKNKYFFDFKYPFSPLQAFAISLSSLVK